MSPLLVLVSTVSFTSTTASLYVWKPEVRTVFGCVRSNCTSNRVLPGPSVVRLDSLALWPT